MARAQVMQSFELTGRLPQSGDVVSEAYRASLKAAAEDEAQGLPGASVERWVRGAALGVLSSALLVSDVCVLR